MFALGLLGSAHCIGMCGPIALAISPRSTSRARWVGPVLYNLGRSVTYVAIGAAMGALSDGAARMSMLRVQVAMTVVSALLMLALGLSQVGVIGEMRWLYAFDPGKLPGVRKLLLRSASGPDASSFVLGLLLGFLPCGLSMSAFTRALGARSASESALLVAAFSVGTFPAMLGVSAVSHWLTIKHRKLGQVLAGMLLIGMAVQQIARLL